MSARSYDPVFIGEEPARAPMLAAHVGSKAAELARIAALGLPTPPAFVLPTPLCAGVIAGDADALKAMRKGLTSGIAWLEATTERKLGDARTPLFVSVRSGAEKSMPGMLDTILDVGMNKTAAHGFIRASGNPRLAFDSYRRFLQSFAEVVGGAPAAPFDQALAQALAAEGATVESELDSEVLERLCARFLEISEAQRVAPPQDPLEQLDAAARAVFLSWESARAKEYRRLNGFESLAGTAVTVQAMAFGNAGGNSGAGVAFSRDPATGEKALYVDFLSEAQGEDVVSGRRTPGDAALLARRLPNAAQQLAEAARKLEAACRDVQDIEFTIERGRLFLLQTRAAKRTPRAALKIAVDLVNEGVIDPAEAVRRLADIDIEAAGASRFATPAPAVAVATVASPGVACGRVAFTSEAAARIAANGDPAILTRGDTSTDDVAGFAVASGILTAIGGRTSHAAVVARQMGKVCLVGCRTLVLPERGAASLDGQPLNEGDWIALDGASGEISLARREIIVVRPEEAGIVEAWRAAAEAPSRSQV